jgi:hypothetical protein
VCEGARLKEDGDQEYLGLKWRTFRRGDALYTGIQKFAGSRKLGGKVVVEVRQPPMVTKSETRSLRLLLRISSLQIWPTMSSRATPANIYLTCAGYHNDSNIQRFISVDARFEPVRASGLPELFQAHQNASNMYASRSEDIQDANLQQSVPIAGTNLALAYDDHLTRT